LGPLSQPIGSEDAASMPAIPGFHFLVSGSFLLDGSREWEEIREIMPVSNGTIVASRIDDSPRELNRGTMRKARVRARRMTRFAAVALAATSIAVMSAANAEDAKGAVPNDAAKKEAQEIFSTRCSACHGASGKGDGPGSAALNPKPRNFTDAAWQKSVTDEYIEKIIQFGGMAVGKSAMMPGNPDLTAKPDVVKALCATIRGLAEKN